MPTHTMQICLHACAQTKHKDANHYLFGSYQIPSTSDCQPHVIYIRNQADREDEEDYYKTPDGPGGNGPDAGGPDDPDNDNNENNSGAPDLPVEYDPLLMLTNAITHLFHATRHRPEDSGATHTKAHGPDTFNGVDPKKL
ncbi:hypothetical protein ID866_7271 [Astraeus odoratus]|nr:hypothetical protein ID866_7271 [Astraeus odoratus]